MMGKILPFRRAPHQDDPGAGISDESLLAACALGDGAALGVLFDRFHGPVYRFLSRFVGAGGPDLDDLVQATFLEVMRSAAQFRGKSAVQTWLFGIAANIARHHVRTEVRQRALQKRVATHPPASSARPDESAERQQMMGRLQGALSALQPDLRTAFLLCDVEGIPGVEVARVLGVREGTLWRRLHDARKALRGALERGTP